jgi:hypothetical protein
VAAYDGDSLIQLTNINDPSASAIDTTAGESAAQQVIDLWPLYAQDDYDASDSSNVAVAMRGTIAVLWERGGTAATVAEIKWDDVFGTTPMLDKLASTGSRARQTPSSNSNVTQASGLTSSGRKKRGWADVESLPTNTMPRDTPA